MKSDLVSALQEALDEAERDERSETHTLAERLAVPGVMQAWVAHELRDYGRNPDMTCARAAEWDCAVS